MVNRKLFLNPGPTPIARAVQSEMLREISPAFGDREFIRDFRQLVTDLKAVAGTAGQAYVLAGSGTMAMEMAVANVTKRGDAILVVSHGYFGDRFAALSRRKGLSVDLLQSPWGDIVPLEAIERQLAQKPYAALAVTHVETSTGVRAPVEGIARMLRTRSPSTLLIVDGVCAVAGEQMEMDRWGVDVLFCSSQKAFGVSPGLALLWAGPRALDRRQSLGNIPEYYMDIANWPPDMHDSGAYFSTPPIHLIWAMQKSVRLILEEGLGSRAERHRRMAGALCAAVESLGFRPLPRPEIRASTLSTFLYPDGADDPAFRAALAEEGVFIAGGLGGWAGRMFRVGHMGSVDAHDLLAAVAAIERTARRLGLSVSPPGAALAVFQQKISQ